MKPREVVEKWIEAFNAADVERLAHLYSEDAINDQVVFDKPIKGRDAIKDMFKFEFKRAKMVCIKENLMESGEWVALEWSDPNGLRGCGFFRINNDQIELQRGYFDQLTFFNKQNLAVPKHYLDE